MFVQSIALLAAAVPASLARHVPRDATAPTVTPVPESEGDNMMRLMGPTPELPLAPGTRSGCAWYVDNYGQEECEGLAEWWGITMEDFTRWNPSVNANCEGFASGYAYCVEVVGEPPAGSSTTSAVAVPSTTSSVPASTTSAGNGIATPGAIQPGMVGNCDAFHKVVTNDGCPAIAAKYGVSVAQLISWNPEIGSTCGSLWLDYYVCVSIIGVDPKPSTTTTAPGNGVATPMPTQPGMVTNCNKFHWINSANVKCDAVISYQKISRDDFLKWNPTVGSDCSGMQIGVNVCVGVIAEAPNPTATQTTGSNGVVTPLPIQPSMVPNCNKFHWIANANVKCADVISYQKITLADFAKWNPSVNSDCSGMWAEVNVCVGVIGGSTAPPPPSTTTTAGNGIQTPQPTQPGMVTNCNKFHWIAKNVNCDQVISYQKITRADFVKWNPSVNSDCSGMWAEVNVCVGVIGGSTAPQPSSTTTASNGIQTPQPIQPGMVGNCKKFHWIANANVKCADVISYQKITLADFYKWNPGVGADCRNMWAGVHQCVGV